MSQMQTTLNDFSPVSLTKNEQEMFSANDIIISVKNGIRRVEGYNHNGQKVVVETIIQDTNNNEGFRQNTMSVCDKLSTADRRSIAQKLRNQHLTQAEIAKKLGVSQKTISNDLKLNE